AGYMMASRSKALAHVADFCSATLAGFCSAVDTLEADWARMVTELTAQFYGAVSRYPGSAFMRMKLGKVFPEARTHIFETSQQARAFLDVE
ncbi:hypothetical protein EDD52_1554, partial [Primorskyibacter sedentarius]